MKCNVCGVSVNSRGKRCPLCNNPLEGKPKAYAFADIKRKKNIPLKILLLLSLITILVTGYIDYQISNRFTWSVYVLLGIITNYITVYYITNSYKDIVKLLGRYGFVLLAICFIWYYIEGWSVIPNYIIPILCIVELTFSDIVALIFKRRKIKKYLSLVTSNIILSLVPILLVTCNISDMEYMAHVSLLLSIVNIFILVIFDFHDLKEEIAILFNY